jgi:AcrR family transcriptional regulator
LSVKFVHDPGVTTAPPTTRAEATRGALLEGALEELSAFGLRRSSMEGVARRAGVSRATVYLHWRGKEELFRALVERLHDEHLEAMEAALGDADANLEGRVVAVLEARFLRFVELTSRSPHAAELYDQHGRLCGDIARESQERSERLLARMLREAAAAGEVDLDRVGLSAARIATVLFDCAHGAKGEDPSRATPAEFRRRLADAVRVLVRGLEARR